MLPWQSLASDIPQWKEVTGGIYPELLINQSAEFTPLFQVYNLTKNIEYNQFEQDKYLKKSSLKFEKFL